MVKDPNNFKTANFNGSTPIDMLFNFCSHLFKNGEVLNDEITSMCAVTLIMAMLEHLGDGIQGSIPQINTLYIQEL